MKGITYHTSGYRLISSPDHPRANAQGYVPEHVLICEKALGKPLPLGALPHHVDGDTSNNENQNLVLCQDHAYHMLIERRTRAFRACGHANWRKCPYCKKWDDPANMHVYDNANLNGRRKVGRKAYHVDCSTLYSKTKREAKREKIPEILCACGCGRSFKPRRRIDRFFSEKCRNRFHNNPIKEQEEHNMVEFTKKRYLTNEQCKATAARISAEMREDREGREKWGDEWAAYLDIRKGVYTRGKKPLHLVIPGDFDQAQAVIEHLFHPEEAAAIIAALTP